MPVHRQELVVPYDKALIFDLVTDVGRYPDFIPWIKSMRVRNHKRGEPAFSFRGEALVGFRGFTEQFTTDVSANSDEHTIDVRLVRGPFRHLANQWAFSDEDPGRCRIKFAIDYEFSNMVLRVLAASNMDYAVDQLMGAFVDEAHRRYG